MGWLLSVEYEPGRIGIGRSCSPFDDRSRDNRLSQDIVVKERMDDLRSHTNIYVCRKVQSREEEKEAVFRRLGKEEKKKEKKEKKKLAEFLPGEMAGGAGVLGGLGLFLL